MKYTEEMFNEMRSFIEGALKKVEVRNDISFNRKGLELLNKLDGVKWDAVNCKLVPEDSHGGV